MAFVGWIIELHVWPAAKLGPTSTETLISSSNQLSELFRDVKTSWWNLAGKHLPVSLADEAGLQSPRVMFICFKFKTFQKLIKTDVTRYQCIRNRGNDHIFVFVAACCPQNISFNFMVTKILLIYIFDVIKLGEGLNKI